MSSADVPTGGADGAAAEAGCRASLVLVDWTASSGSPVMGIGASRSDSAAIRAAGLASSSCRSLAEISGKVAAGATGAAAESTAVSIAASVSVCRAALDEVCPASAGTAGRHGCRRRI